MASRRGQILLEVFYPICVLPVRLATVSTQVPFSTLRLCRVCRECRVMLMCINVVNAWSGLAHGGFGSGTTSQVVPGGPRRFINEVH